jgi:hypothetical protein
VAKELRHKGCRPIIAIDIQGYLRAFEGERVCTRYPPPFSSPSTCAVYLPFVSCACRVVSCRVRVVCVVCVRLWW